MVKPYPYSFQVGAELSQLLARILLREATQLETGGRETLHQDVSEAQSFGNALSECFRQQRGFSGLAAWVSWRGPCTVSGNKQSPDHTPLLHPLVSP